MPYSKKIQKILFNDAFLHSKNFIRAKSYPKINICLKVHEKNANNLHNIESRFVLCKENMYDDIFFRFINLQKLAKISKYKNMQEGLILDSKFKECDIIYKVYNVLKELYVANFKNKILDIKVIKNITIGGGLGGGSSNGAVSMLAMNIFFNLNLTLEKMIEISKKISSDMAFFLVVYTQNAKINMPLKKIDLELKNLKSLKFKKSYIAQKLQALRSVKKTSTLQKAQKMQDLKEIDSIKLKYFLSANISSTGDVIIPFYEKLPYFRILTNKISCDTKKVYFEFDKVIESKKIQDSNTSEMINAKKSIHSKKIDFNATSVDILKNNDFRDLNDLYTPSANIYNLENIYLKYLKCYKKVYFSGSGSSFFALIQKNKESSKSKKKSIKYAVNIIKNLRNSSHSRSFQ